MKVCTKCGVDKPLDQFRVESRAGRDYVRSECKECAAKLTRDIRARDPIRHRQAVKEWRRKNRARYNESKRARYARNPEVHKRSARKSLYGITSEDYTAMLSKQGGVCAVCGEIRGRGLAVDHDHATGKIRGILCSGCNGALGFVKDSVPILEKLILYLKR